MFPFNKLINNVWLQCSLFPRTHRMHSIPLSDRGPFVVSTSFYIQTIRRGEKSFDAAAPKIVTEVALFVCCAAEPIGAERCEGRF